MCTAKAIRISWHLCAFLKSFRIVINRTLVPSSSLGISVIFIHFRKTAGSYYRNLAFFCYLKLIMYFFYQNLRGSLAPSSRKNSIYVQRPELKASAIPPRSRIFYHRQLWRNVIIFKMMMGVFQYCPRHAPLKLSTPTHGTKPSFAVPHSTTPDQQIFSWIFLRNDRRAMTRTIDITFWGIKTCLF